MTALEEQRQETLLSVLQTQHWVTRGIAAQGEAFERMVQLLVMAMKSQSISELQALQAEAEVLRLSAATPPGRWSRD